jgi:flagellar biosynthetic protein FliP
MKAVGNGWRTLLLVAVVVTATTAPASAQSLPNGISSGFVGAQQGLSAPDSATPSQVRSSNEGQSLNSLDNAVNSRRSNATTPVAPAVPNGSIRISGLGSSSAPWTIVVLLTVLTLIPSLMICVTPFARLLVVFHFLRQALGLQTTPSNQTLIGLSLVLTFFIMQPVGEQIYQDAFVPLESGRITALEAVARGAEPLRHFMAHYVREKDAAMFIDIAHAQRPRTIDDIPMRVMMPAYIVSELRAGFQIGAVLFLPFLVVDMVVASITNSIGMMQLPPVVISTPMKLMLFLMVDGWHLLVGALVRSFS